MMSFEEILRILDDIHDLSNSEEKRVFLEIREIANTDNKGFIRSVRNLPLSDDKHKPNHMNLLNLSWLYEILAPDIAHWESFYVEEIDRLTAEAERSVLPGTILEPIDSYIFVADFSNDHQKDIFIQHFARYLNSNIPQIRFKHIGFIGDFLTDRDSNGFKRIEEVSLTDTDWRVRYICHDVLTHLGGSDKTKIRALDSLRGKLFSGYKYD
ncbi:hypothetical protein ACFL45_11945 [Candidatus Neomarinimicrobiota bacterium]